MGEGNRPRQRVKVFYRAYIANMTVVSILFAVMWGGWGLILSLVITQGSWAFVEWVRRREE